MKVSFRCPEWIDKSKVAFAVNGKTVKATLTDGYYTIERKWQDGDAIEMTLPMTLRAVQLPDKSPYYSFMYGPIVLAADMGKKDWMASLQTTVAVVISHQDLNCLYRTCL